MPVQVHRDDGESVGGKAIALHGFPDHRSKQVGLAGGRLPDQGHHQGRVVGKIVSRQEVLRAVLGRVGAAAIGVDQVEFVLQRVPGRQFKLVVFAVFVTTPQIIPR